MHFIRPLKVSFLVLLTSLSVTVISKPANSACTYKIRQMGVAQEIKTIGSHSAADAAKIPLAPLASRTFTITPSEFGGRLTLPPVNVGVTADTVRAELVALATVLNAGVPPGSVSYINNSNGSVTVDFIQTDDLVLPRSHVREIHEFDQKTCQIVKITGYVHGNVICPVSSSSSSTLSNQLANSILQNICAEIAGRRAASV